MAKRAAISGAAVLGVTLSIGCGHEPPSAAAATTAAFDPEPIPSARRPTKRYFLSRTAEPDPYTVPMAGKMIKQNGQKVFKEVTHAAHRFITSFLGDHGLPGPAEFVDEAREGDGSRPARHPMRRRQRSARRWMRSWPKRAIPSKK